MRARIVTLVSCFIVLLCVTGCSRDPEKAKRRYLESGQRYMQQQKYSEAQIQFKNALKKDPKFVEAYFKLATAQIALKQWSDAYVTLQQALALDASRDDIRIELAKLYAGAGSFHDAEEQANTVIEHDPKNAGAYQVLGSALVAQQKPALALAAFKKCVELAPNDAAGYINAGLTFVTLRQFDQAEQFLRKSIEVDPSALQGYTNLSNLYRLTRDYNKASEVLAAGLQHIPNNLDLHVSRADILWAQQRPDLVAQTFDQLRTRLGDNAKVSLAIADFYAVRQAHDKAIAEMQHGLSLDKNNSAFKNRLVEEYLVTGKQDEAIRLNSEVLKSSPKDVLGRIHQGRILLAQNQVNDALNLLRSVAADAPENASAHYHLARVLMMMNDATQARTALNEAIKVAPDSPDVLQALGELQLSQGELPTALEYAQRKAELYPTDVAGRLLLAQVLSRQKKLQAAEQQYKIALQFAPASPEVYSHFGGFYSSAGRLKDAEAQYESALRASSQYIPALAALADVIEKQNQPARAQARVEQFVQAYPSDPAGHIVFANLLERRKDYARCEQELERALQLSPNNTVAYLQLGRIYQAQKKTDAAIQKFSKALELQPKTPALQALLGNLYMDKNDLVKARMYYEQALANDPNFAVAAGNLAWVYTQDGGNLDVALGLAQKAKQLLPEVDSISDTLAWVYYKRANYDSAIELLRDCVDKSPQRGSYRYHLGMALMQNGKQDQARKQLEASLKLDLKPADATEARKALDQLR
ncbi:MAG TPA: tetratricopeptide repeat protein [Clostridia bacterium]|nr:tetratricopeptide repeat protein [Clostridia bacterium]